LHGQIGNFNGIHRLDVADKVHRLNVAVDVMIMLTKSANDIEDLRR